MAMKVMDKDKTSQRSFLHEFSISYLLSSHQNIIGCFGFFFSTIDYFVFAQELAPVGDLFSMIFPNVSTLSCRNGRFFIKSFKKKLKLII